jgi:hypothetical protein
MKGTWNGTPVLLVVLAAALGLASADSKVTSSRPSIDATSAQQVKAMRIRMMFEDTAVTARLDDNETARDLASLLPLTLTLSDYAATEKIGDLPKKLSTQGAPPGYEPSAGDITYYAPWGNLALFHKDFDYSAGLVRLGTIESAVEVLRPPGSLKVRIEHIKE